MAEDTQLSQSASLPSDQPDPDPSKPEVWWLNHQRWLVERGYMLRPRYRPGWKPSWKAHPEESPSHFEDWDAALVGLNTSVLLAGFSQHPLVGLHPGCRPHL